jgi:hypothetical protein
VSFLKKGREAHEAARRAEMDAEKREKSREARRFWVAQDNETQVTFIDGHLSSDGLLDIVSFNEHRVFRNGHWRNFFPCTADSEPCPICEGGDHPALVSLFTVLDHTKWKDKNGKWHQHERRLFVAKRDTLKRLQKAATKRGGLAGWTVTIGRVGSKSAEVGTDFEFEEQHDLKELAGELKLKPEDLKPFNYDEILIYYTADELREMGFGNGVSRTARHDSDHLRSQAKKAAVADDDADEPSEDEDEEEAQAAPAVKPKRTTVFGKKKTPAVVAEDDSDDDDDDFGM